MEELHIIKSLQAKTVEALRNCYELEESPDSILINFTKKEFDGEYTIVLFPYVKRLKQSPQEIGTKIGDYLQENHDFVKSYGIVSGFLNLSLSNSYWHNILLGINDADSFGHKPKNGEKILIEYSSPNTNKPLHLGHIRNILLGHSCAEIYEAEGYDVIRTQIVNDRGIAVCKSMYAWQEYGNGETPESSNTKGDHFVGKYYVLFDKKFREEYQSWQSSDEAKEVLINNIKDGQSDEAFFNNYKNQYFNSYSKIGKATSSLLKKWEADDAETVALWKKLNGWVYDGFNVTYDALGVAFTKLYYESDTYKLGRDVVNQGLEKSLYYKLEDGSIWVDLEDAGLDKKILLRSDGTAVYMTQDIGTAMQRYQDFNVNKMVYVVGDEQNYHFKVLFEILKRLGEPYADGLHHLSYGMVDLPEGKMKSREGTVVDADDLIKEVITEAAYAAKDSAVLNELNDESKSEIYRKIGLAALKFQILKVGATRRMTFDPKESVDMQGTTGPYIQNAFVRIQSILRKIDENEGASDYGDYILNTDEIHLLRTMANYPDVISNAASEYDPSIVAQYVYGLAKQYHKFHHDFRIIGAESESAKWFRISLIKEIAKILESSINLLGIEMPERM